MRGARAWPTGWARPRLPDTWRTVVLRWQQTGAQKWRHLSVREQRLVLLVLLLAMIALAYLALVQPAMRTIERQARELPTLRAQAAIVDALIQESVALRGQRKASIAPQALGGELQASLSRAALGGEHKVVASSHSETPAWEITLSHVSAAALFDWMGHAPNPLRLTLTHAHVERARNAAGQPVTGKASGVLTLTSAAP